MIDLNTLPNLPNQAGCSLSLRIVPGDGKCQQYRKSASQTCMECTAFDPVVPVTEVIIMASRCKIDGCERLAQHQKNGMCYTHFAASQQPSAEIDIAATKLASKPSSKPRCSVAGCDKQAQTQGLCKRHHTLARLEAGVEQTSAAAIKPEQIIVPDDFGKVINGVGNMASFGVDPVIFLALTEAMEAKKADWFVKLSGLKPGQAIMCTADMVRAIEKLEF
jgi:hypothetical protein